MSNGDDVRDCSPDERLRKAAELTGLDKDDLQYQRMEKDAVAVLIHQFSSKSGVVMFGDVMGTTVLTGPESGNEDRVWLYSMPKGGAYVDDANVDYIGKKEKK